MSFVVTQPESLAATARVPQELGPPVAHESAAAALLTLAATQFVMRIPTYATEAVNATVAG
jgi:hypothetical protein